MAQSGILSLSGRSSYHGHPFIPCGMKGCPTKRNFSRGVTVTHDVGSGTIVVEIGGKWDYWGKQCGKWHFHFNVRLAIFGGNNLCFQHKMVLLTNHK